MEHSARPGSSGQDDTIPKVVPARMVNEFEYCPRLFYLEWVQGRFEDNSDTVEGRYVHRKVDLVVDGWVIQPVKIRFG